MVGRYPERPADYIDNCVGILMIIGCHVLAMDKDLFIKLVDFISCSKKLNIVAQSQFCIYEILKIVVIEAQSLGLTLKSLLKELFSFIGIN